ncbi:unnamed protein product [Phytophthora lilii]|uniref:Unnamed protein product n=1 Tax=Phytophthora lilii TaxID=2077276 RepID=A0A9W6U710_9STRA|nr:unnamed protein product [Phytophthora lilii]
MLLWQRRRLQVEVKEVSIAADPPKLLKSKRRWKGWHITSWRPVLMAPGSTAGDPVVSSVSGGEARKCLSSQVSGCDLLPVRKKWWTDMTLVSTTSGGGKATTYAKADGAGSAVMDSYQTESGRSRVGTDPTPIK